jgi:hypothetical protein
MVTGAVLTPLSYDTGLYHLQVISWIEYYRRVFGLANLHARFGFNSIWLVDAALLDFPRRWRYGVFLINAVLYLAIISDMVQAMISDDSNAGGVSAWRIYAWTILAILAINARFLLFDWFSASPGYDMPAALLTIYAFWLFLRMFSTSPSDFPYANQELVLLSSYMR